ncbi:RagB/SusD family nutrient uptake outer membrane protein [Fulvivirga sediminis]|uniref:RagB/SusD family nutrient uptake outer membrane protein n=1 Tax=Fulvivirga sediminis TaxID=2803949 RepID=A0A937F824_9BACT|nr:RagB/SusD family nutrient uptake outer membrane protein [Fulvivirga sediminis]MBL3658172.1 RagB/SusD family nutrient uptake outer membrane protein [Fulvivirga sediminis]
MKKYKLILTIFILIGVGMGCEDKLSLENPNKQTASSYWQNLPQVQAAVNAIYANLQTNGLYSRHMFFAMDNMAHENEGNSQLEADKRQYLEFKFDASHGGIGAFYESCFRGINKANYVITNEDKIIEISDLVSDELRVKFLGEARFLRAFYYFLLVTRFGDVPLVTEVPTSGEGRPITSKEEIYTKIIIPDLEYAEENLLGKSEMQPGRATSGAASALLGKVYLYRKNYEKAREALLKVVGNYKLVDDYEDNFFEETEHNDESIFEIQYNDDLPDADKWNSDVTGAGFNEVTFRGQEYGWKDWFNVYPSDMLLDEYETNDPRFEANFYTEGDVLESTGQTIMTGAVPETVPDDQIYIPSGRRAGWRKYQNYYKDANEDQASGINFRVIRYADVLLMLAEIENELSGDGVDAIGYLNQVRDRVGMPQYGSTEMNPIYPVSTKQERFDAIVHERMVELAGEQARFPDLVRWGLAADVLSQFGFEAGKNEIFPLPQREINSNDKVTNADQNPGYN